MQSNKDPKYRASDLHYSTDDSSASVSMNLASAYPDEAQIIRWKRTLTLDRVANRIHLNEDFQLHKEAAVQLSFMTPCIPTPGPEGKVLLAPADRSGHGVSLSYNSMLLAPSIEKIDLTDDWLVSRWGKTIYRVLLASIAPTDKGNWRIELA